MFPGAVSTFANEPVSYLTKLGVKDADYDLAHYFSTGGDGTQLVVPQ